ncbi:hypothetical protein [Melittangium boletus]|uniref:hypothetical protein n=1 Tax=Melittangium boletus TaxID=83453 RepID=UPI003DA616B3
MRALWCALAVVLMGAAPAPRMGREGRMLFEAAPERLAAQVGEWVTYQLDGGPQQGFVRLAIVGEEKDAKGRDAVWLEMEFGKHWELKSPLAQFRMLVTRDVGVSQEGVSRLFVTQGYEKVQEVDATALPFFFKPGEGEAPAPRGPAPAAVDSLPAGADTTVLRGKPSRLMTLAGTVTAEPMEVRYRQLVLKRYWLSREVPVLHLAKIEFPSIKYALEVRDYGVDAKPRMVLPAPTDKKITLEPGTATPVLPSQLFPATPDSAQDKDPRP